jgi:hypothetical protein
MKFDQIDSNIDSYISNQSEQKLVAGFTDLFGNVFGGSFFGTDSGIFNLLYVADHILTLKVSTVAFDGKKCYWNPNFLNSITIQGLRLVFNHISWHCLNTKLNWHYTPPENVNQRLWDISMEYCCNASCMNYLVQRNFNYHKLFSNTIGNYLTLNDYIRCIKKEDKLPKNFYFADYKLPRFLNSPRKLYDHLLELITDNDNFEILSSGSLIDTHLEMSKLDNDFDINNIILTNEFDDLVDCIINGGNCIYKFNELDKIKQIKVAFSVFDNFSQTTNMNSNILNFLSNISYEISRAVTKLSNKGFILTYTKNSSNVIHKIVKSVAMVSHYTISKEETEFWFDLDGNYHRDNAPAILYLHGDFEWYQHGKKHNLNGPAVRRGQISEWWVNDEQIDCENDQNLFERIVNMKSFI